MEYFSEIYGCYYKIVEQILKTAAENPVTRQEIINITEQLGFSESVLTVPDKLCAGDWSLLEQTAPNEFISKLEHLPQMPLTLLQKRWLKSLLSDNRVSLFLDDAALAEVGEALSDVEPLWTEEQFHYYDRFENGDAYSSQEYRQCFRQSLKAIREKKALRFTYTTVKGNCSEKTCIPLKLEYSPKNDRFRLIALRCPDKGRPMIDHYRLDGMKNAELIDNHSPNKTDTILRQSYDTEPVRLLIKDQRNALERVMLHFANYDKDTRQLDENTWECLIYYDSAMETELLIEIISFGPVVQVTGPDAFVELIRERLKKQLTLTLNPALSPAPVPKP